MDLNRDAIPLIKDIHVLSGCRNFLQCFCDVLSGGVMIGGHAIMLATGS